MRERKIKRDYSKPFFYKRRNWFRIVYIIGMLALIAAVPVVAFWKQDEIQLQTLDAFGLAPTSTPFASERAELGEDFYRTGKIETAAFHFEMAVQQQPENVNYLYEYGMLLIELNRTTEAAELGERIMELAPQDARGYALKANAIAWSDSAAAIPIAVTGIETIAPRQFAPLHSALTIAYTNIGRYQEALEQGVLATTIDDKDANAHRAFAYPLIFTGDFSRAIQQLEQAIVINPYLPGPYFELAQLYRSTAINRPEFATAIYERVIEIDPENKQAYLRMCQTYVAVGEFISGEPYCNQALDIDPDYAEAFATIGQLRYTRRNYEGSIEAFETCIDLYTAQGRQAQIECIYLHGLAYYALDVCDSAWELLNEGLQHPGAQGPVLEQILTGMANIRARCSGYGNIALPTPIPPTPIPPTPIGGF